MTRSDGTPADDTRTEGSPPEVGVREPTQQAVTATLSHADDLLAAAGRLMPELPHLAFHFAALALEEVGRATLLVMLEAAGATTNGELEGAQEDHVAKLFWALWGPSFGRAAISRAQIDEHRNLARYVNERRKAGLYFNPEGPPPRAAITVDETKTLIEMAVARVGMERSRVYGPLDDARAADVRWFVERTLDGQRRYEIFGAASMDKLVQLGNVPDWVAWLRSESETHERAMVEMAQRELARSVPDGTAASEPKWRLKLRLFSASHSIRARPLTAWNSRVVSVQLAPAGRDHRQLIATVTLPKRISATALFGVGLAVSTDLVLALNIGTHGVFWWYLGAPAHASRFYDELTDLETNTDLVVERSPALRLDWGNNALSEAELSRVALCLGVLSRSTAEQRAAIEHYRVGVALLVKSDLFLQFEPNMFEQFYLSLKQAMKAYGYWDGEGSFVEVLGSSIDSYASLAAERDRYVALAQQVESGRMSDLQVNLTDVGAMKLLVDAFLLRAFGERTSARASSTTGPVGDQYASDDVTRVTYTSRPDD